MSTELASPPTRPSQQDVPPALCPACGSAEARPWLQIAGHALRRCARCATAFVWPMPSSEAIAAVYDGEYLGPDGVHGYAGKDAALRRQKHVQARARRQRLRALGYRGTSALDFGCGDGWWLEALLPDHERLAGIEPMQACHEAAALRLPETRLFRALDALPAGERFDLVSAFDVLEHLPAPRAALAELCARLAPGGWLAIVVPVLDHWTARTRPEAWDQLKPPEHLVWFTRASLQRCVEGLGLRVLDLRSAWPRWPRPLPFVPQLVQRPLRPLLKLLARHVRAVEVGIGDSVLLIARRSDSA